MLLGQSMHHTSSSCSRKCCADLRENISSGLLERHDGLRGARNWKSLKFCRGSEKLLQAFHQIRPPIVFKPAGRSCHRQTVFPGSAGPLRKSLTASLKPLPEFEKGCSLLFSKFSRVTAATQQIFEQIPRHLRNNASADSGKIGLWFAATPLQVHAKLLSTSWIES